MASKDFTSQITQAQLKELVSYNPDTGFFYNKSMRHVGHEKYDGYILIKIAKTLYRAHRLAWLYVYGYIPDGDIDHIDGDASNNKINNLRLATRTQNTQNSKIAKNNTTGAKGVSFHKRDRLYQARIQHNGKRIFIGSYPDIDSAHTAYENKAKSLFGQFYKSNAKTFN